MSYEWFGLALVLGLAVWCAVVFREQTLARAKQDRRNADRRRARAQSQKAVEAPVPLVRPRGFGRR